MSSDNVYKTPNSALHVVEPSPNRHTLWFLLSFYMIAVLWAVISVQYRGSSPWILVLQLAMAVNLAQWAIIDARQRNHPIPLLSQGWFLLFAWLLVPGYVVWSRGWRGVGWTILHGFGWLVLWFFSAMALAMISHLLLRRSIFIS